MPAILAAAAVLSMLFGDFLDATAIGAIALLNAVVGFVQEQRAERAVLALREMTAPRAMVVRDGHIVTIPAAEVVVGDTLLLFAGDVVAADARLVAADALGIDEAPLTGESTPVDKHPGDEPPDAPLAERHGSVFAGTVVRAGTGRAEVTATGMRTELGRIAHVLATTPAEITPLQRRLATVGRSLAMLAIGLVAIVAAIATVRGEPWQVVIASAVSLAVAAIPEGLAAIVTIALAIGVRRMAARHVLVRKLPAVETLGSTTVICADKTGTLTTGIMIVREIWGDDERTILHAAAACCDAELGDTPGTGSGDPTELAMLEAARARGIERAAIEAEAPRVHVQPFDAEHKRMSIARADGAIYVKGAIEAVLPLCRDAPEDATREAERMMAKALRVLAIARGAGTEERDLTLLGFVGMADSPREGVIEAIADARTAGIRTVMITGDHPATARAIATELGLIREGDDPSELVHARATPEQKIEIVEHWKQRGQIVAMTGDGVNDAPALRAAHVGIAMGTGTEVTREAGAMVLIDDNYTSIVEAVRHGRTIFDNIRKTIVYLLAGNASEIIVMLAAAAILLPLPLLPLQLLWINLVTDGLPALALVLDRPAGDVLRRAPRPPTEEMLRSREWATIVAIGVFEGALVLTTFVWALRRNDLAYARGMAFTVIVFSELFRAFAARSSDQLIVELGWRGSLQLVAVIALSTALQLAVVTVPVSQEVFGTASLAPVDLLVAAGLGMIPMTTVELSKWLRRRVPATAVPPPAIQSPSGTR